MTDDPNDLLRALRDVDAHPSVVARTRATALAAFDASFGGSAWGGRAVAIWSRFVFPVVLASCVGLYLALVIHGASALYR
jgi:hypothetical protein